MRTYCLSPCISGGLASLWYRLSIYRRDGKRYVAAIELQVQQRKILYQLVGLFFKPSEGYASVFSI